MKVKIILMLFISILLGSCGLNNIEPNFEKGTTSNGELIEDDKLNDLKTGEDLYLNKDLDYKDNLSIKEEINDRQEGYNEINENKEYLNKIAINLENKVKDFKEFIEVTRQLIVVDLKIVNAIQQGFLDEKSINKNNYFYSYLREQDKDERIRILNNMENLIKVLEDKKTFEKYYYVNLDLSKVDDLDENSSAIYKYTNYYLQNVKYNLDIQTNINLILKSMDVLKIDKILSSESSGGFMKSNTKTYIYENTLKNLQKNILK